MIASLLSCPLLADAAPLAGRIAFAAVFAALIVWLLMISNSRLDEPESSPPRPVWKQARIWAIAIATLQLAVYLLWK